jgi:hypothetical protein
VGLFATSIELKRERKTLMISLNPQTLLGPPLPPDPIFGVGTDAFLCLLRLIGNPDAAKQRLGEIHDAAMAANEVIREANEAQQTMSAARKLHDETLLREKKEHDRAIAEAKATSVSECAAASQEINAMRANAEKLQARAKADATAAAELKADLEQRVAKIKAAAA